MPPMGPFFDNLLWIGVFVALIFVASRYRVTTPEGWRNFRSSGKATLSSIGEFVSPRGASRDARGWDAGWRDAGAMPAGSPILERWCADELDRIDDERRRLDARQHELREVVARLRENAGATVEAAETQPS